MVPHRPKGDKTVVTLVKKALFFLVLTVTHHTAQVNQNLRVSEADRGLKIRLIVGKKKFI